jgi:hypothetical protein
MNIVESLQGQFSTELCKKLGGLVGVHEADMGRLVQAGIPCMLAGLALVASKPSGAQSIAKAIDGLGPNAFGSPEKMLESGAMNSGGSQLSNLLGINLVDQIASAVSTYTHMNLHTVKIGLGYLTPFALGSVGAAAVNDAGEDVAVSAESATHPAVKTCDATSISNLFRTHRQSILLAIPEKLPLVKLPIFQAFIKKASQDDLEPSSKHPRILGLSLVSLAVLAAICIATFFVLDRNRMNERQDAQLVPPGTNARPRQLGVSGSVATVFDRPDEVAKNEEAPKAITSIKSRVKESVNSLAKVLESFDDAATAEANSSTLTEAINNLNALAESVKSMPAEGRSVVASLAKSYSEQLNPLIENVLQMPELSDSIRKSLLQVRDKLQAMAG